MLLIVGATTSHVIEPGTRGLKVPLGKTADRFLPEGFGFKAPFITSIVTVNVRQRTSAALLMVLLKPVVAFAEMAARELRYLWWLLLLVALAIWLIWGIRRRPKQ